MSRVLFRPHRGGLDQSMAECKVFTSALDMLKYVCNKYNEFFHTDATIYAFSLELHCFDERINWETFSVIDPQGHVFGWCAFNEDAKTEWRYVK